MRSPESHEPSRRAHIRDHLGRLLSDDDRLVVVSNRGPLSFRCSSDGLGASRGSGGLVTALAELGRLAPVTWVSAALDADDRAAGAFLADSLPGEKAAAGPRRERGEIRSLLDHHLPGQDIRLQLTDVPAEAYAAHYGIMSNPFLWFMQHEMYRLPYEPIVDDVLVAAWRDGYRVVNELLGRAAVEGLRSRRPVVLLQDYHLYLAAATVRALRPEALLLHFNHIPWPSDSTWQLLPQGLRRAILEGLLANDIVGLQTDRYAQNFLASVASFVRDAQVDFAGRRIRWRNRNIFVRAYPISLDPDALVRFARGEAVAGRRAALKARLERAGGPRLIVRVDRLEPSKNVLRGFLAFEALLARRPELRQAVRFLAIQSTSREALPEYQEYATAVREVVARVNRLDDPESAPIWLLDGSDYDLAIAALQLADVVLVNPLVDGMNLVAKEAVLVGAPVLVLSETAGAAEQLARDALMVSAADVAGTSRALESGLLMPHDERHARLRRLRASVRDEDIAWWLARQLRDLVAVAEGARPPSRHLRDTVRRHEPGLEDSSEATPS
ncbi:MAG: alpha,alpha-trehalose-phosphate synthase (UDP-forming) [Candidatus Limnocylindrales bacterium]